VGRCESKGLTQKYLTKRSILMKERIAFAALAGVPWFLFASYVAISHKVYQVKLAQAKKVVK
jgi:hypothetical protein